MAAGTEFYFIISGEVAIYVNAFQDPVEQANKMKEMMALEDVPFNKKSRERFKSQFPGVARYIPAVNTTVYRKTTGYFMTYKGIVQLRVNTLKAGFDFGAVALTEDKPRNASILASKDCYFGILEKSKYTELLKEHMKKKYLALQNFVAKIPMFGGFRPNELDTLIAAVATVKFNYRDTIFKEGTKLKDLFMIKHGRVRVGLQSLQLDTEADGPKEQAGGGSPEQDLDYQHPGQQGAAVHRGRMRRKPRSPFMVKASL